MKFDLKSMTRKQLLKLRSDVDKAIAKAVEMDRKAALKAAEKAAQAHGFSLADITTKSTEKPPRRQNKAKPKAPSTPKYVNPEDQTQTWTGKGRQPKWFKAALASGHDPDTMLI